MKTKTFKLDTLKIEYYKISNIITKNNTTFNVWVQYNGGKSQLNFIIDLKEDASKLDRIFTQRQKQLFLKRLEASL